MIRGLVLGALVVGVVAAASLCLDDIDLENVQDYSYTLPFPASDDYWTQPSVDTVITNYNTQLTLFGQMDDTASESTISVTYYKENEEVISGIEVVCGPDGGTWETFSPDLEEPTTSIKWQSGKLDQGCGDGEIFDVILKVHQPHLMSWIFNGQALQKGTREISGTNKAGKPRDRTTGKKVPSPEKTGKGGAADGYLFKVQTDNTARINRLAWGRCLPWPRALNCIDTKAWVESRSKGPDNLSLYGAYSFVFKPACWQHNEEDSELFSFLQTIIHGDEFSLPKGFYCCCTNMRTGLLATGDEEADCVSNQGADGCTRSCISAYDSDAVQELSN